MIRIDPLKKVIECGLLSPYIKDEKPISVMLCARPESAKTSTMKMYRENKGIVYLTDCTAYGLTRDILPKLVSGEVKTIMIADLLTPLARSTKTRKNFIAFLNNFIEEGVAKVTTYATIWEKEVTGNVITAITPGALKDGRREWASMGFLSRFIIFSFSYPLSTIHKIMEHYSKNPGIIYDRVKMKFPRGKVKVDLPAEIGSSLTPIAMRVGESMNLYGIRAKINFRSLIKTIALRNGRRAVVEDDFEEFLEMSNYLNLSFNPL